MILRLLLMTGCYAITAQANFGYCVALMTGSGLKSA
jgi:hypothetical protein